jgi:hypothetical protein
MHCRKADELSNPAKPKAGATFLGRRSEMYIRQPFRRNPTMFTTTDPADLPPAIPLLLLLLVQVGFSLCYIR